MIITLGYKQHIWFAKLRLVIEIVKLTIDLKPAVHLCISLMQEKFNTYLATDDQVKLEVMTKEFFDDWKDHSETIEDGNQVS